MTDTDDGYEYVTTRGNMKVSDLKPWDEVLDETLTADPALREEWEEKALAREVALCVLAFRSERRLSQAKFGALIGVTQPRVAVIESGEHEPTLSTLRKLADVLGIEIAIDIVPAGRKPQLLKKTNKSHVVTGGRVTVATC
jgi:DNA-binding XRE family transcriptional regulator